MSNKYYWHSRLPEKKFLLIAKNFAEDTSATETAEKSGLTRKSVNDIFLKLRRYIYEHCQSVACLQLREFKNPDCNFVVSSEISLYSPKQKGTPIIFCALFDERTIQTEVIYASEPIVFRKLEIAIQNTRNRNIQDFGFSDTRFNEISLLYYGFPSYYLDYGKSVKQFRDFAKPHFKKLRGIKEDKLLLHLKECEWRFNNRDNNLYLLLLEMLGEKPI